MIAMANAPGSSCATWSNVGATGVGRPDGTLAIRATPCSSIDATAATSDDAADDGHQRRRGPAARRAAGRAARRSSPAENATVTQLMSPSWSNTTRISAKKLSASGSLGTPSSFGSWPAATVRPTPTLMPVSVASEMLSISAPSRSRRAPTQDHADEQRQRRQRRAPDRRLPAARRRRAASTR